MLLLLFYLLLWIPAIFGWGSLWAFFRKRLGASNTQFVDCVEPICGFAALAALSVTLNFFIPIRGLVSVVALLLGWLLGALWVLAASGSRSLLRRDMRPSPTRRAR